MEDIRKENPDEDTEPNESAPARISTDTVVKPKNTGRKKSEIRPLSGYLSCNNPDAVIEIIRKFIINNNTGNGLALPYFALTQLGLFSRMIDNKEYSTGLMKQFEGIANLKSESSCSQAIGNLRKPQYVAVNGKTVQGTLLESDEYALKLEDLKTKISAVAKPA